MQKRLQRGAYQPGGDPRLRQMYEGDGAPGSGFHERLVAALLDHKVCIYVYVHTDPAPLLPCVLPPAAPALSPMHAHTRAHAGRHASYAYMCMHTCTCMCMYMYTLAQVEELVQELVASPRRSCIDRGKASTCMYHTL